VQVTEKTAYVYDAILSIRKRKRENENKEVAFNSYPPPSHKGELFEDLNPVLTTHFNIPFFTLPL
jgi:hypothetical protein